MTVKGEVAPRRWLETSPCGVARAPHFIFPQVLPPEARRAARAAPGPTEQAALAPRWTGGSLPLLVHSPRPISSFMISLVPP